MTGIKENGIKHCYRADIGNTLLNIYYVRNRSLITGRGATKWKIAGPKPFAPPQDRKKVSPPPPPF